MMKFSASAFMLLISTAALQSTKEGRPKRTPLRCQCPKTYSGRPISSKLIQSLRVIPAGRYCKNDEIIATLKIGKTCLNPADNWVISLKEKSYKRKTTVHSGALLSTTEGTPIRLNLHCVCLQTHSEPPIPAEKILSLSLIPAGPHCKNEQIIATMKEGWLCLNPTDDWVISLEKEVYKRKITVLPEALLYTTEGTPIFLNLLCECSQTYSEPPIPAEKILSLRVIHAGPQCKNEQIIATMEEEQMCLDPTKDWVISLITELINESRNVQPVTSNWIQKEVVRSTASFTRETGETFCVM